MNKSADIRRENLRRWAKKNGIPPEEKSYFSQIFAGGAFGEKAARRLEEEYKMGSYYLEMEENEAELLNLFRAATPEMKFAFMTAMKAMIGSAGMQPQGAPPNNLTQPKQERPEKDQRPS